VALEKEVEGLLNRGETGVMVSLNRQFEKSLIVKALTHTGGRRIEASRLLGLGRNTLTRKIQELEIESDDKKSDSIK
jgi:two-component system nitrogen regulation response regulator GlnG